MASVIWLAESTEDKFTLAQVMQKSKSVEILKRLLAHLFSDKYIAVFDMSFLLRLVTPTIEDREKADGSAFM